MKIGFYIHHTTIKAGGVFTYASGILKMLLNSEQIEKICLIYSPEIRTNISSFLTDKKIEPLEIDRNKISVKYPLLVSYFLYDIHLLIKNYFPYSKRIDILKKLSFAINPYKSRINKKDIALLHVPIQYSPVYSLKVPIIITMHDLQEIHFPEFFTSQERLHRAINNKKSLEESSHIIVSFDHVKNDIIKYFQIEEEKISVCPPPFSENWFTKNEYTDSASVKEKYSISEDFILYPAVTWQHKNHINLIKAVYKLKCEGIRVNLICTGNKTEYFNKTIKKEIDELDLNNEIKFLGIISERDLISLYKLTRLVVIPTLYEAGSGPLYEAMRYEVPVICSNVTSLPETLNNDEFIFNPNNPDEISQLIKKGISDSEFRKRNVENSKLRMEFYNGYNYSKNFINAYVKTLYGVKQ
jgi:glycosyltransferase involved in cell wall biosynthesis